MTPALRSLRSVLRAYWRDESGATAIIMVLATSLALIAIAGMVIDLGHVFLVQRQLQASTDAAAIAGAQNIPAGTAIATATAYSSLTGNKNELKGVTVSFVTGYPQTVSFTSTKVTPFPAVGAQPAANGIRVRQQAVVPMFFLRILGINTMTVTAKATAGLKGGKGQAVDLEIILDTTASMNTADNNCSVANATREGCALAGVQALLGKLNNNLVNVGLMVFPGVSSTSQAQYDYDCSATSPTTVAYNASPVYSIVSLGNDYINNGSLNTSSNLVRAVGGGGGSCAPLTAVGGFGTYYSDAITAAQSALTANGKANTQKVIVLVSDGDAGAASSQVPTGNGLNQCNQAITAAQAATAAGTWVYAVAYGAPTGATPTSCTTDTGTGKAISACTTMSKVASDASKFYSDGQGKSGACQSPSNSTITDLVAILGDIAQNLAAPRILPEDTT